MQNDTRDKSKERFSASYWRPRMYRTETKMRVQAIKRPRNIRYQLQRPPRACSQRSRTFQQMWAQTWKFLLWRKATSVTLVYIWEQNPETSTCPRQTLLPEYAGQHDSRWPLTASLSLGAAVITASMEWQWGYSLRSISIMSSDLELSTPECLFWSALMHHRA